MSTHQNDRLRALIEPLAAGAGLDLEEVRVTQAGRRRQLQVVVDADGGVGLDTVAELSREIGQALDDADAMGGAPYVLEVGSPGVDRPLTEPRHWRRAAGRLVKAQLAAGGELVARVLEADDEGVLVEVQPVKGRGRPAERRLEYAEVAKARVQVEFGRKDAKDEDAGAAAGGGPDDEHDEYDEQDDEQDVDASDEGDESKEEA
ncbi:ribosome maturation factor RimP [Streptacidiphilus sp. ASG 303]|uniref:ribosome maturation factor RimP n=1 Tax=Streptacidiphilus sp. ASG 303 TaxID=2896847 RepID=UPI001E4A8D8B|nr:ribosome maturation factor RimP [Streptacidiphilus sp. ASG 303]MCD0486442.1 ribosome maturation factor RimP [Streptacidiphilus sp. ASG 303]